MLDIKFIRDNTEAIKEAIKAKRVDLDLDQLLDCDARRRDLLAETETLQALKNVASKEIPSLSGQDKEVKLLEMKEVDTKQDALRSALKEVESEFERLMLKVPNLYSVDTPVGKDDEDNVPLKYWNKHSGYQDPSAISLDDQPTSLDFEIKDHITLGTSLNLLDLERGVEVSGFRGYYLKNEAVLMQQGLFWHAMNKLISQGFDIMQTPTLVREFALIGSGHFPAGRSEVYMVGNAGQLDDEHKEPRFLAGTSEPSLIGYYADQILDEKDLPIKVGGISPCYRSEAGSYGKDTKGLYRVHEFSKVEQVIICKADLEEANDWLEKLREISEEILQELELPYRLLQICTGDMGAGKYKMYDIETWMPSRGSYGETHSDSNLTDWQARRLNIRYRDAQGKVHHAFTLNNTAVASPRILIAILENYQQADGSVKVPKILQQYVGKDIIKPR